MLLWATAPGCGFGGGDGAAQGGGNVAAGGAVTSGGNVHGGNAAAGGANVGSAAPAGAAAGPVLSMGDAGLVVVPMHGCSGVEYFGDFTVGDDHLSLLLDSGSTSLAVASTACRACNVTDSYDASTGTNLRTTAKGSYGDGSAWTGTLYSDAVSAGPPAAPLTPAVQVKFAAITAEQNNFFTGPVSCQKGVQVAFDGILGLGPDSLLYSGTTSFLTALAGTGKLAHDAYAMQICDVGGNVMLGGYAAETVASAPNFAPMQRRQGALYYYSVAVAGLAVGGVDTKLSSTQLGPAIVDSGTTIVTLPTAAYQALLSQLGNNAAFNTYLDLQAFEQGACMAPKKPLDRASLDAVLPQLQLKLSRADGTTFVLALDASRSYLVPYLDAAGTVQYCGAVVEVDANEPFILGSPALRQVVTIFDRAGNQVGFAPQVGCDPTPAYGGG